MGGKNLMGDGEEWNWSGGDGFVGTEEEEREWSGGRGSIILAMLLCSMVAYTQVIFFETSKTLLFLKAMIYSSIVQCSSSFSFFLTKCLSKN